MEVQESLNKVKKSKTFNRILNSFDLSNKKLLDIGCGNGDFLDNFGEKSLGITTTQEEVDFGKENNRNIVLGNAELIDQLNIDSDFEIVWANNLFEHLLSPHSFLIKLKKIAKKDTTLILGVPIIPKFNFLLSLNKFRGSLASNHINFFTKKSLELTVERAGWEIKEIKSFVFGSKLLDKIFTSVFSPHIYIVAENISDFKYPEKKLKEWEGDSYYHDLINITK
ncbi:MAG: methyltransferase domain-containing protein [Patescibacteria group bacterium]|nr:methyltransferase domain-containing protein [Patescibacteria group bacterium]